MAATEKASISRAVLEIEANAVIYVDTNIHTYTVRVKGAMSLRNGMWHGLRKDIIMRNLIYGKWRKEIN